MLGIAFYRVHGEHLEQLRYWVNGLSQRDSEVQLSLINDGVRHEIAYLLDLADGPVLVYAVEADSIAQAQERFRNSPLPIDRELLEIMQTVIADQIDPELIFSAVRRPARRIS